jgi:hypothetical protein
MFAPLLVARVNIIFENQKHLEKKNISFRVFVRNSVALNQREILKLEQSARLSQGQKTSDQCDPELKMNAEDDDDWEYNYTYSSDDENRSSPGISLHVNQTVSFQTECTNLYSLESTVFSQTYLCSLVPKDHVEYTIDLDFVFNYGYS